MVLKVNLCKIANFEANKAVKARHNPEMIVTTAQISRFDYLERLLLDWKHSRSIHHDYHRFGSISDGMNLKQTEYSEYFTDFL